VKIEAIKIQEPTLPTEVKVKTGRPPEPGESVSLRPPPKITREQLAQAKERAESDFKIVKEMVRKSSPTSQYPPLDGVDRIAALFGGF
jgi:hypothetical protein